MGMEDLLFFVILRWTEWVRLTKDPIFKILHFTLLHSEFVRVTYTTINENVLFG